MVETPVPGGSPSGATSSTARCILLTDATRQFDPTRLSPTLTLVRSCLEIYETTSADLAGRSGVGGRTIRLGQVGIRCRYCRSVPQSERARGSVVHPTSLKLVYQAIRNWQRHHFAKCPRIPDHVRSGAEAGRGKRSQRGGEGGAAAVDMTTFWMNGCVELGLVDADDGCIRFRDDAPMYGCGGGAGGDGTGGGGDLDQQMQMQMQMQMQLQMQTQMQMQLQMHQAAAFPPMSESGDTSGGGHYTCSSSGANLSTHSGTSSNMSLAAMSFGTGESGGGGNAQYSFSSQGSHGGPPSLMTMASATGVTPSGLPPVNELFNLPHSDAVTEAAHGVGPPIMELVGPNAAAEATTCTPTSSTGHHASGNGVAAAPTNLDPSLLLQRQLEETQQQIQLTQQRLEQTRQQVQQVQLAQHSSLSSPHVHPHPPAASASASPLPGTGTSIVIDNGAAAASSLPVGVGATDSGRDKLANLSLEMLGVSTPTPNQQAPGTAAAGTGATHPGPFLPAPSSAILPSGAVAGTSDFEEVLGLIQRAIQIADVYRKRADDGGLNGITLPNRSEKAATSPSYDPTSASDDGNISDEKRKHLKGLMVELGREIYAAFAGNDPFQDGAEDGYDASRGQGASDRDPDDDADDMSRPAKKKPGRVAASSASTTSAPAYVPLRHLFFPVSVCILVSALLDLREVEELQLADQCCYLSLEDVDEDLRLMLDNPEKYLTDACPSPRMLLTDDPNRRLYGRDAQTLDLMAALGRSFSNVGQPEMVFVRGYPGVGKSVLVQQMLPPLRDELGGGMASAAFSQGTQPISVIFSAFDSYFRQLWHTGDQRLDDARERIQSALGDKSVVLDEQIPSLPLIMGPSRSPSPMSVDSLEGSQALQRIVHYLRILIQCIAGPAHPLILFLDDLQWADKATLDLLSQIMAIPNLTSFMFVGTYRENEVDDSHPVALEIARYKSEGFSVTTIEVGNLERASINSLCSDTLHLMPRVTKPLADAVYRKTQGNSFFALTLIKAIQEEKALFYSAKARRWLWNIDAVCSRQIDNDVVSLLTRKMLKLDLNMQWFLRTASCFGTEFDIALLQLLSSDDQHIDAAAFANMAVDEGLLHRELSSSVFRFVHDQVREAAYSIIAEAEKDIFHLTIARQLMRRIPPQQVEENIFSILGQAIKGISLVEDHSEKLSIAKFCLIGGRKAKSAASFRFAAQYLAQGCQLLESKDWEIDYQLALELHTGAANALLAVGDYDMMLTVVEKVLARGRVFSDKFSAYYAMICGAGTQGKVDEVVRYSLDMLNALGVNLAAKPDLDCVREYYNRLLSKMKGNTDCVDFARQLQSRRAKDPNDIAVMKVLTILGRFSFISNPLLANMCTLTGIELCLVNGTTRESALLFAYMGSLACILGDYEEGHRFGNIALALLREQKDKTLLSQVFMVVYGLVNIFVEPLQAGLEQLRHGYETGLSVGDTEFAFTNIWIYVVSSLNCGRPLRSLSEEVNLYSIGMKAYKNHMQHLLLPYGQAILNLMGDAWSSGNNKAKNGQDPPHVLTGALMDEGKILDRPLTPRSVKVVATVYNLKSVIAYLFRQYDVAARCTEMAESVGFQPATQVFYTFYRGLIAIQMCRIDHTESPKWKATFDKEAANMKKWAKTSSWNCEHKNLLFQAEVSYFTGNHNEAKVAYEDSIRLAADHGFLSDQALACERMGLFCAETLGNDAGLPYLQRALSLYQEFGAEAKVTHLLMSIGAGDFLWA